MYGTCSLNIFQTMTYRRKPAFSLTLAYYLTQRLFSLLWLSHALYCWAPSHLWEGHCTNKSKLTDASINNGIIHNMTVNFNPLKSSVWSSHW